MRNIAVTVTLSLLGITTTVLLLTGAYMVSLPLLMSGSILFVITTAFASYHVNHK